MRNLWRLVLEHVPAARVGPDPVPGRGQCNVGRRPELQRQGRHGLLPLDHRKRLLDRAEKTDQRDNVRSGRVSMQKWAN